MVNVMHLLLILLPALLATPKTPPVPASQAPPVAADERLIESVLTRAEVAPILEQGPQRVVAAVEVSPHLERGRFVGFRILRFRSDGPFADVRSLQPGDVVVRVNRESLERPEQFMRAWEVVKQADELEIEVLRGDQRFVFRWRIVP